MDDFIQIDSLLLIAGIINHKTHKGWAISQMIFTLLLFILYWENWNEIEWNVCMYTVILHKWPVEYEHPKWQVYIYASTELTTRSLRDFLIILMCNMLATRDDSILSESNTDWAHNCFPILHDYVCTQSNLKYPFCILCFKYLLEHGSFRMCYILLIRNWMVCC